MTYDRWETHWKVYYWRGLDEFVAIINIEDDGEVLLEQLADPNLFDV